MRLVADPTLRLLSNDTANLPESTVASLTIDPPLCIADDEPQLCSIHSTTRTRKRIDLASHRQLSTSLARPSASFHSSRRAMAQAAHPTHVSQQNNNAAQASAAQQQAERSVVLATAGKTGSTGSSERVCVYARVDRSGSAQHSHSLAHSLLRLAAGADSRL